MIAIGIDVGGTYTRVAAVDQSARIISRRRRTTPRDEHGDALVRLLRDTVGEVLAHGNISPGDVRALGIALPGILDRDRHYLVRSVNLPFLERRMIRRELARTTACPIALVTDAEAATWAEYLMRRPQVSRFVHLRLGTGVACGVVIDRQLQRLDEGRTGHLSVLVVDRSPSTRRCSCGQLGCLETVASGSALLRQARQAGYAGGLAQLRDACRCPASGTDQTRDSHGAPNQNRDSHGAANQNRDSYGAANQNRDSYGAANQNRDSHGAANQTRDSHGAPNQNRPLHRPTQGVGGVKDHGAPNQNRDSHGAKERGNEATGNKATRQSEATKQSRPLQRLTQGVGGIEDEGAIGRSRERQGAACHRSGSGGEARALALMAEAAEAISQALTNLVERFQPEVISLGGGVIEQWPVLFEASVTRYRERRARLTPEPPANGTSEGVPVSPDVTIERTRFGDDAGVTGAALLAFEATGHSLFVLPDLLLQKDPRRDGQSSSRHP